MGIHSLSGEGGRYLNDGDTYDYVMREREVAQ